MVNFRFANYLPKNFSSFLLPFAILLFVASNNFFVTFTAKSPYTSDSYFYRHLFYEMKGQSFFEARANVLKSQKIRFSYAIEQNVLDNRNSYMQAYPYFGNRVALPFLAFISSFIFPNEDVDFLIPVFSAYIGIVILLFYLFYKRIGLALSFLGVFFLIYFPPFLNNATNFMTDTLGLFLFLLLFLVSSLFVKNGNSKVFILCLVLFVISLFNREQSLFFIPALLLSYLFYRNRINDEDREKYRNLFLALSAIGFVYLFFSAYLGKPSLLESFQRFQNSYGYYHNTYATTETLKFLLESLKVSHIIFLSDLKNNFYSGLFFGISLWYATSNLFRRRLDFFGCFLASMLLVSYFQIFLFPIFDYRYFFPAVVAVIYFALCYVHQYMKESDNLFLK